MPIAFCTRCRQDVRPEHRLRLGQRFFCPHCCTEIEAVSARPMGTDGTSVKDKLEDSPTDAGRGELGPSVTCQRS